MSVFVWLASMNKESINEESISNFSGKKSPSMMRAVDLYRKDPEAALAGRGLVSVEGDNENDRSLAIVELAGTERERFIELVGSLPEPLQDIFFQHYLLGRTQTQIARLIDWSQSSGGRRGVSQGLRIGERGMCAVIAWGKCEGSSDPQLHEAYEAMERFRSKRAPAVTIRAPRNLGSFVIRTDDEALDEFFAPGTTDGAVRRC
jgi:hypothetical protein